MVNRQPLAAFIQEGCYRSWHRHGKRAKHRSVRRERMLARTEAREAVMSEPESGYDIWPYGDDNMPAVGDPDDDYEWVEDLLTAERASRSGPL